MRFAIAFLFLAVSTFAQSGMSGSHAVTSTLTVPQTSGIPSTFLAPGPIHPYLPLATVNITLPNTSGYTTQTYTSFADLQSKINTAATLCDTGGTTGYVLSATSGSAFSSSSATGLVLPASSCVADYIIITTAGFSGTRGVRIDPSTAAGSIAQLSDTAANGAVLTCAANVPCNNYWFLGMELQCIPSGFSCIGVQIPSASTDTPAHLPNKIIFDHVYVHGRATNDTIHAFFFGGNNIAIVDSWVSDAHNVGQEAQAISGFAGGPRLYQNNFLEHGMPPAFGTG